MQGRFHWYHPRPLDLETMRRAARLVTGCHDFVAFQTLGSPRKTTVRTIRELSIQPVDALDGYDLQIEIEADGFLYNMARNLVGALVAVGVGRFGPAWISDALASKERCREGRQLRHMDYA